MGTERERCAWIQRQNPRAVLVLVLLLLLLLLLLRARAEQHSS